MSEPGSAVVRAGPTLTDFEPESVELPSRIQHEAWQTQFERLGKKLARDAYWMVFEPLEQQKPEPLYGSISDDLADIWRDVKEGLVEMDSGTPTAMMDAAWHWRFSFETHWAQHAAGAICSLTALCFGQFADETRPRLPGPPEYGSE